jgi:hypothetical protein
MTCPFCSGRGWQWVGQVDNATREGCEPCAGVGRGRVNWPLILLLTYTLALWALVLGLIWLSTTAV